MSSEYNSHLISILYTSKNEDEIIETLQEIEGIGDAVFLYPVLDAFRRYKDSYIDAYFIYALEKINSKKVGKILESLLEYDDTFVSILSSLDEMSYYPEKANSMAKHCIENLNNTKFRDELLLDSFGISIVLDYLKGAKIIEKSGDYLRKLLFEKNLKKNEKATILSYLLRINPKREIGYLMENYEDKIKGTELDIILAKELVHWRHGRIPEFKKLIINKGHERAKEIIENAQIKDKEIEKKTIKEEQEKEDIVYGNIKTIEEINELRKKINNKIETLSNFHSKLFIENNLLIDQQKTVMTKSSFIEACVNLRTIIIKMNNQIQDHNLKKDVVDNLLINVKEDDRKKPLNRLYLYLKSNNINVSQDIFGLRTLNRVVSLAAHPEKEEDLLKELSKIHLLKKYQNEEWSGLHKGLLNLYKQFLERLNKELPNS